jgi:(1->4)-alpha-D-glucan 1-alpha-D-glucosylmutase
MPRSPEGTDAARPNDRRDGYPPADEAEAQDRLRFAMRFQQYTGPVHAKGLEDTAFYRYNLLLSLNEVGGDADRVGRAASEFHEANLRRLSTHPYEMVTSATHDTKLGEDTRARINVISEMADAWSREVGRWMRVNKSQRTIVEGELAPDRNDEYRFYQALVGIFEIDAEARVPADLVARLQAYMIKSVKEAKLHTSWLTPNQEYESAVSLFVERVLTGAGAARFVPTFLPLARRIAGIGMLNGLAQVALKLTSTGVPDVYQGTELWDFSLVDPDNRRPVDFAKRQRLLDEIDALLAFPDAERALAAHALLARWEDGAVKMLVTAAGLRLRRAWRDLFLSGRYLPLVTETAVNAELLAFARIHDGRAVLTIVPRLAAPLVTDTQPVPLGGDAWKTSRIILPPELHGRTFRHLLTGATLESTVAAGEEWLFAGQVFAHLPVGILTSEPNGPRR